MKLNYLEFKLSGINKETPELLKVFEVLNGKISKQQENELDLNKSEQLMRKAFSEELFNEISKIKLSTNLTKEQCCELESSFRTEIRELNSLKFEFCLYDKNLKPKNQSYVTSPINPSLQTEELILTNTINTINSIASQEKIERKTMKRKETFDSKSSLFENQVELKFSNLEHYQLKCKLNSIKEDHLLFSNFIDFRLNPSKFERFNIDSQRNIEGSMEQIQNNLKITQFNEISCSERCLIPSTYENISPHIIEDVICAPVNEGSWDNFPLNCLDHDEEIERVLNEEVVVSWGKKNGILQQIFSYFLMAAFLIVSKMFNLILTTKRRLFC